MKQIGEFKLKDGRMVQIVLPSMQGLKQITDFVNKLSQEDTFLSFSGEQYSLAFEKNWLKNALNEIKFGKNYIIWALYNNQIIGGADVKKGGTRDTHVGTIGLMVDKDFRGQGLGKLLLDFVLKKAKEEKYKIVKLDVFADNFIAINLYLKMGFKEYGRLPKAFYRKNKFSDKLEMYKNI